MLLLPLVPSVHPSARLAEAPAAGRQALCQAVLARDKHTCRFCGLPASGWQAVFHLDDDHDHWAAANLAAACVLCHGVQHIGGPAANQDMHVIWLPEVEQAILNVLVRSLHLILHRHDAPATLKTRHMPNEPDLLAAWRAYAALHARTAAARQVIDSDEPGDLARALLAMAPPDYRRREQLLGGLRLLHRGQRLRGGRDLYPAQLAAWAKQPSPSPS